jgi:hypothetical protein
MTMYFPVRRPLGPSPIVEQLLPMPSWLSEAFAVPLAPRSAVESVIEGLIALLDESDGDADLEDTDEDCCAAHDDDPRYHWCDPANWPGDDVDAEGEERLCL